jgi:hypothetical protein
MENAMRMIGAASLVAVCGMLAGAPARADWVVKFLAVEPHDGGYISFACRWVPYGAEGQPLRTYY